MKISDVSKNIAFKNCSSTNNHGESNKIPLCGDLIEIGSTAEVFEDKNDVSLVLKKYDLIGNIYDEVLNIAREESILFNIYYGDHASEVICYGGDIFVSMLRVPGITLDEIQSDELPKNIEEIYLTLIADLNEKKIIHVDLNAGNILYDSETNRLFPIDFRNAYDDFYGGNDKEKASINRKLKMRTDNIYHVLNRQNI